MGNMIVVIVAACLIYYIGREVLASFRHLSEKELEDFWAGRVQKESPKAHRRISEHLVSCDACRDRLDEVRKTATGPGVEGPMIERKYYAGCRLQVAGCRLQVAGCRRKWTLMALANILPFFGGAAGARAVL